ncbi:MAG: sigma-70 family RNA polymerase sigma factor [Lentisphaeraceae bacterium]|nr:sigma-70 family RNA polymerase sigma factor [Lentisphaeraceae bacterium]
MDNSKDFTKVTLLMRLKESHDEKSWDEFHFYYAPYVRNLVRQFNLPEADVSDVTQLILVRVWKSLPTFNYDKSKGLFRSWLAAISRNATINFLDSKSSRNNRQNVSMDDQVFTSSVSPEVEKISEKEWRRHISALAWDNIKGELSDRMLISFTKSLDGIDKDLIAEELKVEANTVQVYKQRVANKLCKEINRLEHELNFIK